MTSISGITTSQYRSSSLTSLDTNGDGVISAEELEAAQTSGGGRAVPVASSDEEGGLTQSAAEKFLAAVSSMLFDVTSQLQASDEKKDAPKSPSEMFPKIDSDGDGLITEAEFVAARPEDVSEEQAVALFASFDIEGSGSLTEEQFVAAFEAGRPEGPPPPPPVNTASADEESDDDSEEQLADILARLQSVIAAYLDTADEQEAAAAA